MIKIESEKIEFFENLAQSEFGSVYYDFHNDYLCNKISQNNECLEILLDHIEKETPVTLKFFEVEIVQTNFNFMEEHKDLTIDILYKGRFEVNGQLFECSSSSKSYFYLEFYEGQSIEFFCSSIGLD